MLVSISWYLIPAVTTYVVCDWLSYLVLEAGAKLSRGKAHHGGSSGESTPGTVPALFNSPAVCSLLGSVFIPLPSNIFICLFHIPLPSGLFKCLFHSPAIWSNTGTASFHCHVACRVERDVLDWAKKRLQELLGTIPPLHIMRTGLWFLSSYFHISPLK